MRRMTTSHDTTAAIGSVPDRQLTGRPAVLAGWAVLGLFILVWLYSGVWTLIDLDGARATAERLGFPGWTQVWTGALNSRMSQ